MHYGVIIQNLKGVNRVIRFLVCADLLFWGGWGLVSPIFALFATARIATATVVTVGIAVGIYFIVKSVVQIPIASYLDRTPGEKDDFYALVLSLILGGFAAMAFLTVETVEGLFLVSALQGVTFGVYTPAWLAIFSRHLDPDHNAFDWALDSTTVGFAYGASAIVGGGIAGTFGFTAVFIFAALLSFGSGLLLIMVPNLAIPKPKPTEADPPLAAREPKS